MSASPRKSHGTDQHLLAVVGIAIIVFGLMLIVGGFTDARQFAGYPLVLIGVLVLILRAFHRRLKFVKLFNKIELALTPEAVDDPPAEQRPVTSREEAGAPTLREVSRAAENPNTDRHRRG
jgi:hypothetical protein